MKHEIRAMLKTGGGSIVNCSSFLGKKGVPGYQVYSASKHAVEGLTKSVALEYAKQGIRVNALAPGPIVTEMFAQAVTSEEAKAAIASQVPQGRLAAVEEMVPPVLSLLDPANMFVTGVSLAADGGMLA